jgi:ribosomal protein S18 acetylase RimI-like enzyme
MVLNTLTAALAEATLGALYLEDAGGPSLGFLSGLLAQPQYQAWGLLDNGNVVAAIWYQCVDQQAELLDLRVGRAARRSGYGGKLLADTLCLIGQSGVRAVDLEVRESNTPARSLYAKAGFEITGRRRDYYSLPTGEREDALLMSLTLQAAEKKLG